MQRKTEPGDKGWHSSTKKGKTVFMGKITSLPGPIRMRIPFPDDWLEPIMQPSLTWFVLGNGWYSLPFYSKKGEWF